MRRLAIPMAFLAAVSTSAHATDVGPGIVTNLYVQNGVMMFSVEGGASASWSACAVTKRYATEITSASGQAYYTTVISAKMAGKPIKVYGSGACTYWADSEAVKYIHVP